VPAGLNAALSGLSATLDERQATELWQLPDRELAAGAVACARLVSRTQALLVRLLGEVDARDLPLRSGACSTTAWTRHELNTTPREARTLAGVATAVRNGMTATGTAFAAGDVSLSQAVAITGAVGELPEDIPADIREQAETELVGYADRFDAQQLARLGAHILTVVAPEIGEARDAEALERQERQARRRRELFLHRRRARQRARPRPANGRSRRHRPRGAGPTRRAAAPDCRRAGPAHRRATPRRRHGGTRPPRPARSARRQHRQP